jgi:hypothetical protein
MTAAIYIMFNTIVACCLLVIGWNGTTQGGGYLHYLCLIAGGMIFGHLATEILNYDETDDEGKN